MPCCIDTKRLTPRRVRPLALAMLMSGVLVTGCGGTAGSPAATTTGSATTAASSTEAGAGVASSSSPPSPAQLHQDLLRFAECMRSNGVPSFPDPSPDGGGFVTGTSEVNPAAPAVRAARAKCQKLMPGGGPPTQTHPSVQTLARFRGIAKCMRRHGVPDFPDPRTSVPPNPFGSGAGVISDIEEVIFVFPATIDQQSPAFTQAAAACAFPLHNH